MGEGKNIRTEGGSSQPSGGPWGSVERSIMFAWRVRERKGITSGTERLISLFLGWQWRFKDHCGIYFTFWGLDNLSIDFSIDDPGGQLFSTEVSFKRAGRFRKRKGFPPDDLPRVKRGRGSHEVGTERR